MAYVIFACLELTEILGPRIFEWYSVDGLSKTFFYCVCVSIHITHVKVRGQLVRVSSFLLPLGFWNLNSGLQAWQQVPFPAEPSHWPLWML